MDTPLSSSLPLSTPHVSSAAVTAAAVPSVTKAGVAVPPVDKSPSAPFTESGGNADSLPPVPGAKLRLMCSYGGHIMPRPHDKSLTYVGGETRLVVVDRHSSLASLRSRLSRTLLNGRCFSLKYQLPNEDLDSLVSITTEEDLENMIDEYDRITSSSTTATHRIRLFLFANKLETAATIGSLLDTAKSDTWFVDALNQSGLLPRGFSDTAVENCLLNLDDISGGDAEAQTLETNAHCDINKQGHSAVNGVFSHQEMHLSAMPDSPLLETASSSYGSSSSTPSMANLPPIRVRVSEEQRMEEQFAPMSYSNMHIQRQMDEVAGSAAARPPVIPPPAMVDAAAINNVVIDGAGVGAVTNAGMIGCQAPLDDERPEPSLPAGYRKPPLPLQQVAIPPRAGCGYGLSSPDSVASDNSVSSATSLSKPTYYQDQAPPPRVTCTQPETTSVPTSHVSVQPVTFTSLDQHQPLVQQPCMHQGVQYIPHPHSHPHPHPSSYIPVCPHQQQNYPVYVMPVAQPQPCVPPLYPNSKPATNPKPDTPQNLYRPPNPQVLQLQPQPQPQLQCVGYSPVHHHALNTNYGGYECPNQPTEAAFYHTQSCGGASVPLVSQYQSMTPATAAAVLADASKQMAVDCTKQHIAVPASQPL